MPPADGRDSLLTNQSLRSVKTAQAIILGKGSSGRQAARVAGMLDFFGVPWCDMTPQEFMAIAPVSGADGGFVLFADADAFQQLLTLCGGNVGQLLESPIRSAFVYSSEPPEVILGIMGRFLGNGEVSHCLGTRPNVMSVSSNFAQLCGLMTGVCLPMSNGVETSGFEFKPSSSRQVSELVSVGGVTTLCRLKRNGFDLWASSCPEILDISAELGARNFDIREHAAAAIPIVLFIKWAFPDTSWHASRLSACVVIDDPLLKPRYGFVDYRKLLLLMEKHHFSTNIAFIPWNWRRSDPRVVALFRENPDKFSLSIHGCDHIGGEFGISDRQRLIFKSEQAIDRMHQHESLTGIRHDRVMVFPQGIFSTTALDVLKRTGFIGAVNSEVLSTEGLRTSIRISDVWDVAVMAYASSPIFTRRYPSQGVENFAFDLLLGKPCIIVTHHDSFRKGYDELVALVDRINALSKNICWRNLGGLARRSCRERALCETEVDVQMYGTALEIENYSSIGKRFRVTKRETGGCNVQSVCSDFGQLNWTFNDDYMRFDVDVRSGERMNVAINFCAEPKGIQAVDTFGYRIKTGMRRYLSEARDNYVMRNPLLSRVLDFVR